METTEDCAPLSSRDVFKLYSQYCRIGTQIQMAILYRQVKNIRKTNRFLELDIMKGIVYLAKAEAKMPALKYYVGKAKAEREEAAWALEKAAFSEGSRADSGSLRSLSDIIVNLQDAHGLEMPYDRAHPVTKPVAE